MFKQKQVVEVDLNQLIEQVKRGERASVTLSALTTFFDERFYKKHQEFVEALTKGRDREFYSWDYPFDIFDVSLSDVARVMNYKISEEMRTLLEEDIQKAAEYNKNREEEKENE